MRRLFLTGVLVLLALGAATAKAQRDEASANATLGKTCGAPYVRANLSWGVKCLRAGEFCKVGNVQYHRYGFTCPASGHLTRFGATSATKTSPTSATPTPTTPTAPTTTQVVTTTTSSPAPAPLPVTATPTTTVAVTTTTPAPAASGPPAGATAVCRDGTYSYSQHRSGTCSSHGGVATWLADLPA